MEVAGGDCGGGASVAEVDGRPRTAVEVGVVAVAKLAKRVATPAGDGAVVEERTCVSATDGDCGGGASVTEVNG